MKRLFTLSFSFVFALLLLIFGSILIAQAQESIDCPDISVSSGNWFAVPSATYASAGSPPYLYFDNNTSGYYQINLGLLKAAQITFGSHCDTFSGDCSAGGNLRLVVHYANGTETNFTMNTGTSYSVETYPISSTKTLQYIRIYRDSVNQQHRFAGFSLIGCVSSDGSDICPTVQNAHFAADEGWLLDNGATITNSILSLPVGGVAAQNLTLQSTTAYSAVISTTAVFSGSTSLDVRLGTQLQTIEITTSGRYTAAFTTPSLSGPIEYSIENTGPDAIDLDFTCVISGEGVCRLIPNSEFVTEDGWALGGTAAIADGLLTLGKLDDARQNLTLETEGDYAAVISAISVTDGPVNLRVSLGDSYEILSILEPGLYTATLSAPANIWGPVPYVIKNEPPEQQLLIQEPVIQIDYTCLSNGAVDCIAPVNGNFDTADNWGFYRGASWESLPQNAFLPYNTGSIGDKSLVVSTSAFTLPTITTGSYLVMGFEAKSQNQQAAILASRANSIENSFEIFESGYKYEADLTGLAGETVELAFANVGNEEGFPAQDAIELNNICIFISDRPPTPPIPTDPSGGINPADFGFNFTCNDLPGILAAFGIDVVQLEATYEAGVSIWEPQNWVPWLASALWMNAGRPISCLTIEQMRLLAGLIEQNINEFLNYVNWVVRSSRFFIPWFQQGFIYLRNVIVSPAQFARNTAAGWLVWFSRAERDIWDGSRRMATYYTIQLQNTINGLGNTFVEIWNDSLLPALEASLDPLPVDASPNIPGGGLFDLFSLLNFLWALANVVWWAAQWLWENVISVATIPITFYHAFNDGLQADGFSGLISCSNQNFWCALLAGIQLVNQSAGDSILYPATIVGIILTTIFVFWKYFWTFALWKAE